jgi:hypothetical protein
MGTPNWGAMYHHLTSAKTDMSLDEYFITGLSQQNSCTNGINETHITALDA